jgi:hypothetical protein
MRRGRLSLTLAIPLLSASLLASGTAALGQGATDPSPAPASTPVPEHTVAFDGFAFTFAGDLASSVNISTLVGDRSGGPSVPTPPSTLFSLYGRARAPKVGGQRGQVQLFRVADLPADGYAAAQLRQLNDILDQRPDLDPVTDGSPDTIPLLVDMDAAQGIRALATYVDTDEVTGIAFVTAFVQDAYPYSSASFTAIFQGRSVDGSTAILASFPLTTQLFPKEVPDALVQRVSSANGWQRYQRQAMRTLAGAGSDAFSPSLRSITALIDSMTFAPVPEPGASPSATPSGG